MKFKIWTKPQKIEPGTMWIKPELVDNIIKLHIVNFDGGHMDPYWLIRLTSDGLRLDTGVGQALGFELTTNHHIRAIHAQESMINPELLPAPPEPDPKPEPDPPGLKTLSEIFKVTPLSEYQLKQEAIYAKKYKS